ncbi:MAG: phytoene/squalene synthase family protein [Herminiimonas sp.]|nr:phytoene/squalene synthase family protein [Herminiimonas sp.]
MIAKAISPAGAGSFADANTVLATHGRSFYWARSLLGKRHAVRATRLYRFCRYIDDLADESASVELAAQALDELSAAILHQHAMNPLVADALALMRECGIDPSIMLELIRGVQSDLVMVRFADENSLLRYCYRVAGTVGIMMCRVLDVGDEAALPHAIDLGIGMQLTNICRDVADDAVLGRRYLPASLVGDCEPAALLIPDAVLRPAVTNAVAALLTKAEAYYQSGEDGLHYLPAGARTGILVAARLYRAIGRRLDRRSHDYWTHRTVVPPLAKMRVTLRAVFDLGIGHGALSYRGSKTASAECRRHDPQLHVALTGLPHTVFSHLPPDHEGG